MGQERILIVDDDSNLRKTLVDILKVKGYTPVSAETGQKALEIVETCAVSIALVDLKLEDVSGLTLIQHLGEKSPGVDCIVLTGHATQESAIRAVNLGAYSYLQKPYDIEFLLVTIRRAIEKQQAERALRESEERLRNIVDHSTNLFYTHTPEEVLTFVSPQCRVILDCEPEEAMVNWTSFLADNPLNAKGVALTQKAIDTGIPQPPYELELKTLKGRRVWVEVREAPLVRDGKTVAIVGALTDISERRNAEASLKLRVAQLTLINDIGNRVAAELDVDRALKHIVEMVHNRFGYHHVAAFVKGRGQDEIVLKAVAGAYAGRFPKGHRIKLGEGVNGWVAQNGEKLLVNDVAVDPRYVNFFPDAVPTRAELSVPIQVEGIIRGVLDIQSPKPNDFDQNDVLVMHTLADLIAGVFIRARLNEDRERLEEQSRQAQKMEAVGRLAAGIAHDFNNLLTAINGFAELMQRQLGSEAPQQKYVDYILHSGKSAADLVGQLLAFSRKQAVDPKILNINSVISGTEQILKRIIGENVELETNLAPELWTIKADAGQIEQIIMNLSVNARDAMPNGGKLMIETTNVRLNRQYAAAHLGATPGPHVLLTVSDTGHGMNKEQLEHIFEPFYTTKGLGKGTGLGLATVFGIVRQNQGNIWVYSEPNEGTAFKVYFPAVDSEEGKLLPDSKVSLAMTGGNETILLVEDHSNVRELAGQVLRDLGYHLIEAEDGRDALRVLADSSGSIDLLLTDVIMPNMNGKILADKLIETMPDLRVLFMSGYTNEMLDHQGIKSRTTDFIAKPFSPAVLAEKVRAILDS